MVLSIWSWCIIYNAQAAYRHLNIQFVDQVYWVMHQRCTGDAPAMHRRCIGNIRGLHLYDNLPISHRALFSRYLRLPTLNRTNFIHIFLMRSTRRI